MKSENKKIRNNDIRVPFNVHAKIYIFHIHFTQWGDASSMFSFIFLLYKLKAIYTWVSCILYPLGDKKVKRL